MPNEITPENRVLMTALFGKKFMEDIDNGICPQCHRKAEECECPMTDEQFEKEYYNKEN